MTLGTAKAPKFIAVHDIALSDDLRHSIIAYHAFTGCYTVSKVAGYGKTRTWTTYKKKY